MGSQTNISWADKTFNPWIGCSKVSPGCANCYAERDWDRRYHRVKWGPHGTRSVTADANWAEPLKWDRDARSKSIRYRVFCASLADVFEDWKGPMLDASGLIVRTGIAGKGNMLTMHDLRTRLWDLIDATPNLDWMLLTKRPENIRRMFVPHCLESVPGHIRQNDDDGKRIRRRDNVWLGASVENQEYADSRIPELLKCRDLSPVLFLSCEPLLGPVDLAVKWDGELELPTLQAEWVIAGGESGPDARPSNPDWFRSLREQCDFADVPFHFKQWGQQQAGRVLDGRVWDEFPSNDLLDCFTGSTTGF